MLGSEQVQEALVENPMERHRQRMGDAEKTESALHFRSACWRRQDWQAHPGNLENRIRHPIGRESRRYS